MYGYSIRIHAFFKETKETFILCAKSDEFYISLFISFTNTFPGCERAPELQRQSVRATGGLFAAVCSQPVCSRLIVRNTILFVSLLFAM